MNTSDQFENTLSEAQNDLEMLVQELIEGEHKDQALEASESKINDSKTICCKVCGEKVELFSYEKFKNGTKKWVDSEGKIANGKMCPKCNVNRAKNTMRRIRSKEK